MGSEALPDALTFAVRHLNASARDPIDEAALLAALRGEWAATDEHHLRTFFDETALETLSDLARSGVIGYRHLAESARRLLPADHDTLLWLDERA